MASNPPLSDLPEQPVDTLLTQLAHLKDRPGNGGKLIAELKTRAPDLSHREIARRTGLPLATVSRWAGRTET